MWKKNTALTGAAAGALMVAGLVVAAPAHADLAIWLQYGGVNHRGYGQFQSYGDVFRACDEYTDNMGIRVDWYVVENPGKFGSVSDLDGNNNHCASQNLDLSEKNHVSFHVCLTDNGRTVACTRYYEDSVSG